MSDPKPCRLGTSPSTAQIRSVGGETPKRGQKCSAFRRHLVETVLEDCRNALNRTFKVEVPRCDTEGLDCVNLLKAVKNWSTGHEIVRACRKGRLGRRERAGCISSFALLKKCFPNPCGCLQEQLSDAWADKQSRPEVRQIPDGFLDHVDEVIGKIFRPGWDLGYWRAIARYPPNGSSCVEANRRKGGARSALNLDDYLDIVSGQKTVDDLPPFLYKEVLSSGKLRPLTITPAVLSTLRPLHKMIYNRISSCRWLLRGTPDARKFKRAGFKFDKPILSGDYQSATDNLDLRVSSRILEKIFESSRMIPESVKDLARRSLNPDVIIGKGEKERVIRVSVGQMMGSLLSFPLLCLYNRVATTFAMGFVPMLINGDDVVAEASQPKIDSWFRIMPQLGLQPERQKSGVSRNSMDINSTRFLISNDETRSVLSVPTVRCRSLVTEDCLPTSFGSKLQCLTEPMFGAGRRALEKEILRRNMKMLSKCLHSGLSLRDLGFKGTYLLRVASDHGLFRDVWCTARKYLYRAPLPTIATQSFPDMRVYGDLTPYFLDAVGKLRFAREFGRCVLPSNSREVIQDWWHQLAESAPRRLPTRTHSGVPFPANRRPFGELCSRRFFLRREAYRMMTESPSKTLVPLDLKSILPHSLRWGYSTKCGGGE